MTASTKPCPGDADYGRMHHALGRPAPGDDLDATLRNFFLTAPNSPQANRFEALGLWTFCRKTEDGSAVYRVNAAGKAALAKWLRKGEKTG